MTSKKAQPGFFARHDNIYVFVPNLIGTQTREPCLEGVWNCDFEGIMQVIPGTKSSSHQAAGACGYCHFPYTAADPCNLCITHSPQLCCTGYARVVFSLYAFSVALISPTQCVVCYFLG